MVTRTRPHILVVGGGYVGMYAALRLQRRLHEGEAAVTVVDPQSYMTYQPFLPEAAAGSVEPRHVVVPLRRVLPRCRILSGRVISIDHAGRRATIDPVGDEPPYDLPYDVIVVAPGSVARTLPIPGLAEHAIGFKTVGEAIWLRNHVLSRLELAASTSDRERRRRALTFAFIGGGYAGIEAFAELEDMARDAVRYYPGIYASDMRWVMIEATGRILPEVSPDMGQYTVERLRERGMDVRLETRVTSLENGQVELDNGECFPADTVVWTAGVRPHPLLRETDLPVDDKGRLIGTAYLNVEGVEDAWTAGDCAAIPDLSKEPGALCGPSAQHAVRQARRLADNILAELRAKPLTAYEHSYAGSVASLGLHKGVAEIYGVKIKGYPAWFMHRTYHMSRVPTFNRKVRVIADWSIDLFFRREIVSLGVLENPREEFVRAAQPPAAGGTRTAQAESPDEPASTATTVGT
jgi:NADH:ubiquinone reductase (H+-translocating)